MARDRERTKARIIDAVGGLLTRSGFRAIGVNAVAAAAGVDKVLIYRYFGGLPGLVTAWGKKNQVWPDLTELADFSAQMGSANIAEQIKRIVIRHANSLRDDSVRVELLADEIMTPTAISEALSEIRRQLGREHQSIFARNPDLAEGDNRALIIILMAAASYLAMRAVKSPQFMGRDIGSDEGWSDLMHHFELIIDRSQN